MRSSATARWSETPPRRTGPPERGDGWSEVVPFLDYDVEIRNAI